MKNRLHLPDGGLTLKSFKSPNSEQLSGICPVEPVCPIVKYRTIDGSCNNLRRPKMGQALTPLSRVLPPAYADGMYYYKNTLKVVFVTLSVFTDAECLIYLHH